MDKYRYNTAELPDINAVWTDKETYKYAHIHVGSGGEYYDNDYFLALSTAPWVNNTTNTLIGQEWETDGTILYYGIKNGVWEYNSSSSTGGTLVENMTALIWSNHDFLNEDGSVYLAASDPIPVVEPCDKNALLLGCRVGQLIKGMRGKVKEPVAFLYGPDKVRLPKIPEVEGFEFVYIYVSYGQYTLMISTQELEYRSWKDIGNSYYLYPVNMPLTEELTVKHAYLDAEEAESGTWEFTWSKTYEAGYDMVNEQSGFGIPFWANTTVMNHEDGSIYLAASDPVPVYE